MKLFLLFTIVPLTELFVLLMIAMNTGLLFTVCLVLATAVTGATMLRWQGLAVMRDLRREVAAQRIPQNQLIDGFLILLGGVLMITPGVLTDIVGILTLVPPTRRFLRETLKARFKGAVQFSVFGGGMGMAGRYPPPSGEPPTGRVEAVEQGEPAAFRDDSPFSRLPKDRPPEG